MKHLFLLTGMVFVGLSTMVAEVPEPKTFSDAYFYAISPNGEWGVSQLISGIKVYNFVTGQVDEYVDEWAYPTIGIGRPISNNGVLVGSSDGINPEIFVEGEWFGLDVPDDIMGDCLANSITPDGSRICGSIGLSGLNFDGDVLMQAPVVWNATDKGYGMPVRLPYPEFDITGRVPQYCTAVDISEDGKTVIGQIMSAVGGFCYPIIYTEDAEGNWSYDLVHSELYTVPGLEFPEYPGDGPEYPDPMEFMNADSKQAYNDAIQEWQDSGYTTPYPEHEDYMTDEEKEVYDAAMNKYNEEFDSWMADFNEWFDCFYQITDSAPNGVFNSVRISPDAKTWAYTIEILDPNDMWATPTYNTWVFETGSDKIYKYNQTSDLNLTYLGNDGVAFAATNLGTISNSYVLKEGVCDDMLYWMNKKCPVYSSWMNENMRFTYEDYIYNEEIWDYEAVTKEDVLMTGRGVATPDFSVVALSVENVWDYMTEFEGYLFDIEAAISGVESVRPATEGKEVIYDLSGRKLNSASAPGIYIINGKKQVVR